ncbi:MAG: hypothetical protein ACI81P_000241 [Neolewinella sp.]|jgi:hypothetical protein
MAFEPLFRKIDAIGDDRKDVFDDSSDALGAGSQITGLVIRHGSYIDAIEVRYGDHWLPRHGGKGGTATVVNIPDDDYLVRVSGTFKTPYDAGTVITMIKFETKQGIIYGPYCSSNGTSFEFAANEGEQIWAFLGSTGFTKLSSRTYVLASLGVVMIPVDENRWVTVNELQSYKQQLKNCSWGQWKKRGDLDPLRGARGYSEFITEIQQLESGGIQTWIDCFDNWRNDTENLHLNPKELNSYAAKYRKPFEFWLSQSAQRFNTMRSLQYFLSPLGGERWHNLLDEMLEDLKRRKVTVEMKATLKTKEKELTDTEKKLEIAYNNTTRLQGTLDTTQTNLTKTKETLTTKENELTETIRSLNEVNKKRLRLDEESKKRKGNLKEKEKELANTIKELNGANEKGIRLDNEIEKLIGILNTTKKALEKEIKAAATAADAAAKKLNDAQQEAEAAKELAAKLAAKKLRAEKNKAARAADAATEKFNKAQHDAEVARDLAATTAAQTLQAEKDRAARAADAATKKFNYAQKKAEEDKKAAAELAATNLNKANAQRDWQKKKWELIQDKDLLMVLPLGGDTKTEALDYSGNKHDFSLSKAPDRLISPTIIIEDGMIGLTVEAMIWCSAEVTELNLVTVNLEGIEISMGMIKEGQMFLRYDDKKLINYASEEKYIPADQWVPWVFQLKLNSTKGNSTNSFWLPNFHTTTGVFKGHKKDGLPGNHPISGDIALPPAVKNLSIQIAHSGSSKGKIKIKNLRVYNRVLSQTEIDKNLAIEVPESN